MKTETGEANAEPSNRTAGQTERGMLDDWKRGVDDQPIDPAGVNASTAVESTEPKTDDHLARQKPPVFRDGKLRD